MFLFFLISGISTKFGTFEMEVQLLTWNKKHFVHREANHWTQPFLLHRLLVFEIKSFIISSTEMTKLLRPSTNRPLAHERFPLVASQWHWKKKPGGGWGWEGQISRKRSCHSKDLNPNQNLWRDLIIDVDTLQACTQNLFVHSIKFYMKWFGNVETLLWGVVTSFSSSEAQDQLQPFIPN